VAPKLAARTFATLDQFAGGRIGVHIITGGSDGEQRRDGDYLSKDERYDRTDEYLDILKLAWTSEAPFDYQGRYYRLEDFYTDLRSPQQPPIPLYFGGSSDPAYRVGGKHADIFALWGEPLAQTAEQSASVRATAQAAANPRGDNSDVPAPLPAAGINDSKVPSASTPVAATRQR
jgi:alkanesulfonate monooxygenase